MIDAHCHLERMEKPKEVAKEALERGMEGVVTSAASPEDYEKNLALSSEFKGFVHSCLGLHPTDCLKMSAAEFSKISDMIYENKGKIVAIGEIGLDYHWIKDEAERREAQRYFELMIDIANDVGKPVVIHCRDAWEDCFRILKRANVDVMFHCFTGKRTQLDEALDRGYFISYATLLVKSKGLRKLAKKTPLESMLLETDAPWLDPFSPELVNRPWKISFTADKIAKEKGIAAPEVEKQAAENARKLFKI